MSGIAIKNISRIKKENIEPTLHNLQINIFDKLSITKDMWTVVGSVGKKPDSGDLDICIDINKVLSATNSKDIKEYANKICIEAEKLGWQYNNKISTQLRIIHLGIPIINQSNEIVQIDIMNSINLNYAKFRYYSPSLIESKYKGGQRRILLSSIWWVISYTNIDNYTFSVLEFKPDGLTKRIYSYKGKNGKLKNPIKLNSELFDLNIQQIINTLFDNNLYIESDFNSFESIWNNVLFNDKFPYKEKRKDIILKCKELLNEDNSLIIPDEINNIKT